MLRTVDTTRGVPQDAGPRQSTYKLSHLNENLRTGANGTLSGPSRPLPHPYTTPRLPVKAINAGWASNPLALTKTEILDRWWNLGAEERDREFSTPKEVMGLMRRSESRVRALCDELILPSIKIAGRIQIHKPSLLEFLRWSQGDKTRSPETTVSTGHHGGCSA